MEKDLFIAIIQENLFQHQVRQAEFVESKNSGGSYASSNASTNNNAPSADGFMNIPDGIDEELPFN